MFQGFVPTYPHDACYQELYDGLWEEMVQVYVRTLHPQPQESSESSAVPVTRLRENWMEPVLTCSV